jgi:hypothetical protein
MILPNISYFYLSSFCVALYSLSKSIATPGKDITLLELSFLGALSKVPTPGTYCDACLTLNLLFSKLISDHSRLHISPFLSPVNQ